MIAATALQDGLDILGWVGGWPWSGLGTAASIIGLGVTVWVALEVRKLADHYVAKVRLPTLLSDLKAVNEQLSEHMNDLAQFGGSVPPTLKRLEALLKSIKSKVSGDVEATIDGLVSEIRGYFERGDETDEAALRRIYAASIGLHQEVSDYHLDKEWER